MDPDIAFYNRVEELCQSLLESAPDAIIVSNENGEIVLINRQAENLFGYQKEELLGQKIEVLLPQRLSNQHAEQRKSFCARPRTRPMGMGLELYGRHKSGTHVPVEISLSPLRTSDALLIISTVRDISERKKMESELDATKAQVASSARLAALGTMAGSIAHEINNPLAIIHACASNLMRMAERGDVTPPVLFSEGERIRQTAKRIAKIVKNLRHISREGVTDPFEDVDVSRIVEEALELCRERFRIHSVTLTTSQIEPGLQICCREVQIAQVLLNLLQNAFDAVVEQEQKRVELQVNAKEGNVIFAVIDSGRGIPKELRFRIMQPFFTTKEVGKGTGLGLSISRAIAEDHGGRLELLEHGERTCFLLIVPMARKAGVSI